MANRAYDEIVETRLPTHVDDSERAQQDAAQRVRYGWRLVWAVIAVLVLGLILSPLVAWWLWELRGRAQLQVEFDAIVAKGEPITNDELEEYFAIGAGEPDASDVWLAALASFDDSYQDDISITFTSKVSELGLADPLPPEVQQTLDEGLVLHREKLVALYRAADTPGEMRHPRDVGVGNIGFNMSPTRSAMRLLGHELRVLVQHGDIDAAMRNVEAQFALCRTLHAQKHYNFWLFEVSLQAMMLNHVQMLVETGRCDDAQLAQLQEQIRTLDPHGQLARALIGSRPGELYRFHRDATSGELDDERQRRRVEFTADAGDYRRAEDAALLLQIYAGWIRIARLPVADYVAAAQGHPDEVTARMTEDPLAARRYALTRELIEPKVIISFANADGRAVARRDAVDAACAIYRFHLRHGQLPERLEQLVPELLPQVPIDPFDGQPLRYRADKEVVIYSIGDDRIDQGGHGLDPDQVSLTKDFEIRLKPPLAKP